MLLCSHGIPKFVIYFCISNCNLIIQTAKKQQQKTPMDIDFYNSIQTKIMDSVKSNSNQIPGDAFHTDQSEFKCFIVTLYNYEDRSLFHIRSWCEQTTRFLLAAHNRCKVTWEKC